MRFKKLRSSSSSQIFSTQSLGYLLAFSTVMLAACSVKDSDGPAPAAEYVGPPADAIGTETLQRNAASATGENMNATLNSVLQALGESAALGKAFSFGGLVAADSPTNAGVLNDPNEPGPLLDADFTSRMKTEAGGAFDATLGLSGSPTTTRNGNLITVDPDESAICLEQVDMEDRAMCEQLLADLTVNIDADTDKSGTINYLFRNNLVAEVGYSPIAASYELKLKGLRGMLARANELDSTMDSAPDTMTGSLRWDATVLNATAGSESGSMSMSIPEALTIVDTASGTNLNIAPSTLMKLSADSGTGNASMEVNIGALAFASRTDDFSGSQLQKFAMSGMTARMDITRNGDLLSVSNVGLGNGPLTMSVDSLEYVRASLGTFGFTVDPASNSIALNGDLNFAMSIKNVLGQIDSTDSHDASMDLAVTAASGSTFVEVASGAIKVGQGGPLSVNYDIFDGITNATKGAVSIQQGQCFDDSYATDAPIAKVGC